MKKLILLILAGCLLFGLVGCNTSPRDMIQSVKKAQLEEYPDKKIESALKKYFRKYDLDWSAFESGTDIYTVEAEVALAPAEIIEFKPNNISDLTMFLRKICFSFDYDHSEDAIVNYKIYGIVDDGGESHFFETQNRGEASLFLNRIYGVDGKDETSTENLSKLYKLKKKVQKAKSDKKARKIAGDDDCFPLDTDYMNDDGTTKDEILTLIDSLIDAESEIHETIKNMYQ